ncbi:cyclophilin family peptidyl-prolyl cis-trans isomerase [Vogesella perlucida]|jgi:peptidylprolyl isomerase/peptidyl-prolyl cis-trans isomerase A (cyclophilin A)/peptidyl-prolyl cis-trans isomerase B (cyclophilin B)|nr:cyclophilin family peptidyl-prolyl cis-trans isomerase [Vogesella perlucida]
MKKLLCSLLMLLPLTALAVPTVEMTTNKGLITIELDPARAPKSVENFVAYVKAGHYNGTVFHRIIDGFMIQGGGFAIKDGELAQKPTRAPIANEADNGLKNVIGSIAMARTNDPNSATSQFFINLVNNDFLDFRSKTPQGWGYAVFGKVTAGMDVVNRISKTRTGFIGGMQDVPIEPIVITKAIYKP